MGFARRHVRLVLCSLLIAACARNPATGKRQLNFVSRDQEIALGGQAAQQVAQTVGLYDDPALQKYVSRLGQKVALVSERPKLPWQFAVVDDPAVNAFALPGGYIFVTRGILAHLDNEAQLVSVLGHEVGHVTAQHSVNQMSKAQLAELGLGVGMIFSETLQRFGQIGMAGLQLMFLKFGRDDERQADALGFRYAIKTRYDVREMPDVFRALGRVSRKEGGSQRLPGWLATHPDPDERVERTEKRVRDAQQNFEGFTVGEDSLLRAVDGLVYGDDPREGYFEGSHFCQPTMGFCLDFPEGFQTTNTKQAVLSSSPRQDAALELSASKSAAPQAALEEFFEKSGATPRSRAERIDNGVAAVFEAQSEQGAVSGVVAFMRDQRRTYRVLGIADPNTFASYANAFTATMRSFRQIRPDERERGKHPMRIHVDTLSRAMSVEELAQAHPAATAEDLALINQVDEQYVFPEGSLVKWIGKEGAEPKDERVGLR